MNNIALLILIEFQGTVIIQGLPFVDESFEHWRISVYSPTLLFYKQNGVCGVSLYNQVLTSDRVEMDSHV